MYVYLFNSFFHLFILWVCLFGYLFMRYIFFHVNLIVCTFQFCVYLFIYLFMYVFIYLCIDLFFYCLFIYQVCFVYSLIFIAIFI